MSDRIVSKKVSHLLAAIVYVIPLAVTMITCSLHWSLPLAMGAGVVGGLIMSLLLLLLVWRHTFVRFHALQGIALIIVAVLSWGLAMGIGINSISQGMRTGAPPHGSGDTAAMLFIGLLLIASFAGAGIFGLLLLYFAIQSGRGRWTKLWIIGGWLRCAITGGEQEPTECTDEKT